MRKKIVAGNWKMNGTKSSIQALLLHLIELQSAIRQIADCIVFPPAIYLPLVSEVLENTPIQWGAQNIYPREMGAYTGEISTKMVSDYRCKYVLVGHSERRTLFGENEKIVAEKFHHVKEHGMIPILCVGETLEEREKGETEEIILKQLHSISEKVPDSFSNSIIAYEPVWAIGTGKTANVNDVQKVHRFIRAIVAGYDKKIAENLPLIYGGSVNEKNASALFSMPDVDGGLVGGASLNAQQFVDIIQCIN